MPRFAGGGRYRPHDDQDEFAQSLTAGQARSDAITEGYEEIARADADRARIGRNQAWLHSKREEEKLKDAYQRSISTREEQLERLERQPGHARGPLSGYRQVVDVRTGRESVVFDKEIDRLQNEIQDLEDDYQAIFERPEFDDEDE